MFFPDVESLRLWAADFAGDIQPKTCIALHGDLGVGKTEVARAIIRELCGDSDLVVPSPTFTIVQEYECPKFRIYHFDLYRIKHVAELEEIGLGDALGRDVVLIEWPEVADYLLPQNTIHIHISARGNGRDLSVL